LALVSENGDEIYSRTVNFDDPAIAVGAQTAAVYDVGGKELYVIGSKGLLRDMSGESGNGVLSVSLNASDYMAVTTLQSGCRASVTAYDASGAPVFTFRSSEHYVSDACVLSDNRHLAAVTLGEEDGIFASVVSFYSFDSEKVLSTTTLAGSVVLRLENFGGKLAVFEDNRLTVFDAEGALAGSCRYSYPYLKGRSVGGGSCLALLLSRYRSGASSRIVTVNSDGEILGTLDERREILDVSAAERYVAVLYADSLTVYTPQLEEYATLSDTGYAKKAIMCSDGSVLLLGSTRAWRYVP
ncbi:MAG: hypothetical protein J5449_10415, partial [Oscillospiraceae bacterium]|nr:hypothetical protein [Oscillospiraceae bacterium]